MASAAKDLTQGKPLGLLLRFALPLMLGSIFQQLYTIVDAAIVGQFVGVEALAAIGAVDWFHWLVLSMIIGFAQGFTIIPAQKFGARDKAGLHRSAAMALVLTGVLGVVLTAVILPLVRPVLRLLDTEQTIFADSATYVSILFSGILIVAFYNVLASLLRAIGNSRDPLIAMIIGACVNIGLDLLFVLVFHWGIVGAAVATLIGQCCACLYTLLRVVREPALKLARQDWRPEWNFIRREFLLGMPMALQSAVIGVGGMVVQQVVNGFGYVFVAGYTATNKLWGLLEMAAINYGYAVTSYTGQNLGAGRFDRIRKGVKTAACMGFVTALIVGAFMILLGRFLAGLFISSEDAAIMQSAVDVAYDYLVVMCIPLFILYLFYVYRAAIQGSGDTVVPFASGVLELLVRIAVANTLPAAMGAMGVYLAEPLAWLSAAVMLVPAYYLRIRKLSKRKLNPQ